MKHISSKNQSLLEALAEASPGSSKNSLKKWILDARIFLDGTPCKRPQHPVKKGQVITLGPRIKQETGPFPILYEDAHLYVIDKPSGLLSVATAFESEKTAHSYLKRMHRPHKVYVIHRLDQDTSGVMLFAKTEEAYRILKAEWKVHKIQRNYLAIVEGVPEPARGTWSNLLFEDANYEVHVTSDPQKGEQAITHYEVLEERKPYTLMRFTLETGKKNQIRAQCRHAGCPIAGDPKYGAASNPIKRLCLHAQSLEFQHPITQKRLKFVSSVPKGFIKLFPKCSEDVT